MKQLKYFIALTLLLAVVACTDTPETPDPVNTASKEAFEKATQIGVYQQGKEVYLFDKAKHQLYISPSNIIMRIQDNEGVEYVELQLNSMPEVGKTTDVTLRHNINLSEVTLGKLALLKASDGCLWLWSDTGNTGFILPWIAE